MKTAPTKARSLTAALLTFGLLVGGANAALTLTFDDRSGNTVVTLTATNLNLTGLVTVSASSSPTTFIHPKFGWIAFTGSTDTSAGLDTRYSIPTFIYGTGDTNTFASALSVSNTHIFINGRDGYLYTDNDNPLPQNFTSTATYSGSIADNGIDITPQTITFSNGEQFQIKTIPEPSSVTLFGLGGLGLAFRRLRR